MQAPIVAPADQRPGKVFLVVVISILAVILLGTNPAQRHREGGDDDRPRRHVLPGRPLPQLAQLAGTLVEVLVGREQMDGARRRSGSEAVDVLPDVNAEYRRTAVGHPRLGIAIVDQIVEMDAVDGPIEATGPHPSLGVDLETCDGGIDQRTELPEAFQQVFASAIIAACCGSSANAIDVVIVVVIIGCTGGSHRGPAAYPPRQSPALSTGRHGQPPAGPPDRHGDGPTPVVLAVHQLEHLLVAALRLVSTLGLDQADAQIQIT